MNAYEGHIPKTPKLISRAKDFYQKENAIGPVSQIRNTRPGSFTIRLQRMANNSPQVKQLRAIQKMANNHLQTKSAIQLTVNPDGYAAFQPLQEKANVHSGNLSRSKTGVYVPGSESDRVPARKNHLPREAWHVVQQKHETGKPPAQLKKETNASRGRRPQGTEETNLNSAGPTFMRMRMVSANLAGFGNSNPIQPIWVRQEGSTNVTWEDTEDLSGYDRTEDIHGEEEGHAGGNIYLKHKKAEADATPANTATYPASPANLAFDLLAVFDTIPGFATTFFQHLDSKELWLFAQTGKLSMGLVQQFVITYFPRYEDRFIFNLATKGLLLHTRPSIKYGGEQEKDSYPEHATSGFQWYSGALKGNGVIVLGDLKDYQLMRDYDSLIHSKEEAKAIETNAKFLMAWPWSLLVNAALVTGAIHGGRSVVGATEITKKSVFKPPDGKDTFGLTVYAREMIQLMLKHQYATETQDNTGQATALGYPKPAVKGGYLITPTNPPNRPLDAKHPYATIFDVGKQEEEKYDGVDKAETLVGDLHPPAYEPISYQAGIEDQLGKKGKEEKKSYDKLRKDLKALIKKYEETGKALPAEIVEMQQSIYPGGSTRALPSIKKWEREAFQKTLNSLK